MLLFIFYGAMLAITIISMCIALARNFQQSNYYYPAMFLLMALSNGGFLALCCSDTLDKAILAGKIFDAGGCFLTALIFLCVLDLCKINLPFCIRLLLILFNMTVYALDLSAGHTTLFYASEEIHTVSGITVMTYTAGSLYFLLPTQLICYTLAILGITIHHMRYQKSVSYKNLTYLLIMIISTIIIFFTKKIIGYELNLIPMAYAICSVVLMLLLRRMSLYDITYTVAHSQYTQESNGYILFDHHKALLSHSPLAVHYYPELAQTAVDYPLPNIIERFEVINSWLNELDTNATEPVVYYEPIGDREIKATVCNILLGHAYRRRINGYLITLSDVTDERKYLNLISKYNEQLKADVEKETRHVKAVQEKLILGMANMIENRDNSTGGHIKRTSSCIAIIVNELKKRDTEGIITDRFCEALIKAAPMHDIGKIAVDDDILRKPGRFTNDEYEQMKEHAEKGAELLKTIIDNVEDDYFIQIAENMAHYHHERWNGTGYPEQRAQTDIPLEARIMALADVYDALVSERCYKPRMSFDEAADIIRESMGTHFDPMLADVFEACRPQLETYYSHDEG